MAFAILVIVIISFFRKGGDKVAEVVDASKQDGIKQGAQIAVQMAAAKEAEKAKVQSIEDGNTEAVAKVAAEQTYRREMMKGLQDVQNKLAMMANAMAQAQAQPQMNMAQPQMDMMESSMAMRMQGVPEYMS